MSSTKVETQNSNRALLEFHTRIKDYIILEKIGHGAYASVYKACKVKDKNEFVAVKCFEKTKLSQPEAIENIVTEIKMLKMLRHPSIVQMSEFLWDDRFVYIVMEYCDGGDLSKFIQKRHRIPEKIFQKFLQQLAMALFYLRGFNISHLDLKPSNLLLSTKPQFTLKIGDFGLAQFLSNEAYQGALRGSPLYMAPEMLLRRHFDAKCDLWSVGIIAYECLFGKAPFSSCNFKELRDKLIAETPIEIPENSNISRRCRELLRRLLKYNPEERIDFEQFFSHPFVDVSHQPSPKTYSYAVELLHQAVKHDAAKEFKEAFGLYCDALSYLIPHVHAEKDEVRKQVLQSRLLQYTERAEALLAVTKLHKSQGAVQSPRSLKEMCLSTPALLTAIEIGINGDLYFAEHMYKKAQEKYEIALEMLIDLIPKEPPGLRKDRLLKQTNEWMSLATRSKALADMAEINNPPVDVSEVKEMCVLQ